MKLTTQELDEMQRVDIGATSADTLPDVSGMAFQKGLSREDRITRFMQGAKNLYCYCVGGVGVKIEFAESGPSLQDTLGDLHSAQASGRWCPVPAATRPRLSGHLISGQIWVQLPQCSAS